MKTFSYLFAIAAMAAAAPSMAGDPPVNIAPCQGTHTPGTSLVCQLYASGGTAQLVAGQRLSTRILLPLNTTIDDDELPSYFVTFNTEGGAGRVRVSLTMSDDVGGHAVELGSTESTVQAGGDTVTMSAAGHRFAQPGHLNVSVERIDEADERITLQGMTVIQSDPNVEAVSMLGSDGHLLRPWILH